MIKESETLLRIIGTSQEVGTHAAVPEYMALTTAIKEGRDVYRHFASASLDRELYRQAVIELVPFLNQMSYDSFSRLLGFMHDLEFDSDIDIGQAIKRGHALPNWCEEQLFKRAAFLQYFGKVIPPLYTLEELEKEEGVREKHPWQWIDAIRKGYPERAQSEIILRLKQNPEDRGFYNRVPAFVHGLPEEFVEGILIGVKSKIPEEAYRALEERVQNSRIVKGKI